MLNFFIRKEWHKSAHIVVYMGLVLVIFSSFLEKKELYSELINYIGFLLVAMGMFHNLVLEYYKNKELGLIRKFNFFFIIFFITFLFPLIIYELANLFLK